MTYPDNLRDYLIDLQLDLNFNKNRLESADPEAVPVILRNIQEIERDIARYSAILRDSPKTSGANRNALV